MDVCVLIPVFNHQKSVAATVEQIMRFELPVLLVDDGSSEECREALCLIGRTNDKVHLEVLNTNCGKGAAVKLGLRKARQLGYTHAIQVDADGQHNVSDIPRFIAEAEAHPWALIAGAPKYDDSIPKSRLYGRYLTHVWVWINTLSLRIRDSMCGFRVYPLAESCRLVDEVYLGNRMDFDTEFMVRWFWRGLGIQQIPTSVTYPQDGVSHFRKLRDNWLISLMHSRLFFGMLARAPGLLLRRVYQDRSKV